ncbi:hypothetical protein GC173_01725 [bacterium]|nr:hypothetical protein [bacterium]
MSGLTFVYDLAIVAAVAGFAGLACRRIGLSTVVGFLVAGILVGPYTPPFQLVQDAEQVRVLSDLGLLFLVFGIGLSFSVRRLQRLGMGMILATAIGALLVLAGSRLASSLFGFTTQQGLFIAAVLMVSSSAIISKVLEEIGSNHTRWGQLSLGITLLEDIVAVVMITLLSSLSTAAGEQGSLWQSLLSFTGFVAVLFLVILLLVPRLLRHLKATATDELVMLLVAGLLLVLGWSAVQLGYSMALTAFILGAIIGSTPQRQDVDRLFEGMRHLFGAVFFVAMGMMFDVSKLADFWVGLLALAAAAFVLRIPATALALAFVGNGTRDSLRAAFSLTPLGEFSFVIAFLGVQTGVMPEEFYPAAVGASLLTCMLSPMLIKRAEPVALRVESLIPARLLQKFEDYRAWLANVERTSSASDTWQRMSAVIGRTIVHLLLIAGCLALLTPAYEFARESYGPNFLFPSGTTILFVLATGVIILVPLLSVWRNLSILSGLIAESTARVGTAPALQRVIERGFTILLCALITLWLLAVVPADVVGAPAFGIVILLLIVTAVVLWRNLLGLQESWSQRVQEELAREGLPSQEVPQWNIQSTRAEAEWKLNVKEIVIPANSSHAGRQLLELRLRNQWSCSVVGIDRQGYAISNPSGTERLYPGDRVLLLGEDQNLAQAAAFLNQGAERPDWTDLFDELLTELVTVPPVAACVDSTLLDLDFANRFRIQVGGIRRDGVETLSPSAQLRIRPGDELLLIGTHANIARFREFVAQELG